MTTTPESWDDVGCLRLQVDCLSSKVEDLEDKLRHKLEQEEQHENKRKCRTQACGIITAVLFGCILALLFIVSLLIMIVYTGSTQKASGESSEVNPLVPTTFTFNTSGISGHVNLNLPVPAAQSTLDQHRNGLQPKQKPLNSPVVKPMVEQSSVVGSEQEERTEKIMSRRKRRKDAHKAAKTNSGNFGTSAEMEKKELEPKKAPEDVDVFEQSASSILEAKRTQHAQRHAQSISEIDPYNAAREAAEDAEGVDSDEGESFESGKLFKAEPWGKKKLATPIDLGVNNVRALPSLSSQSPGVVWVCFPARTFEHDVKAYASAFIEVARSRRWMVYPFCFLDTRELDHGTYSQHFCDDDNKVTFVMEKARRIDKNQSSTARLEIPRQSRFDECMWFKPLTIHSPVFHRRMFPPDQEIQASLVEDFLYDVHSGRVPEITPVTPVAPRRRDL